MEELAKDLQTVLKDFNGCTVQPGIDDVLVYKDNDIITPYLAETIFEFSKVHSLNCYIGVSFQGHLRFVLYKD